jgi:SAM-dependent methyltransferase
MPNDDAEQTRLNIIHQVFLMLLDGELTKAPVPQGRPCRILDIGTGPGDWAVEMGEKYPDAQVIATDISVFDAGPAVLGLPNVHFQLDDAEAAEWSYQEPFELIHFRGLSGAFRNWETVYQQSFKNLRAGGYIEVVESEPDLDAIVFPDLDPNSYYNILASAMKSATTIDNAIDGTPRCHLQPSLLTASGFIDVRNYDITVPLGTWPNNDPRQSTLGKMMLIAFLEGLEARCLRPLTATGNWTASNVRDICEKVMFEVAASKGATVSVRFVTGRKPMSHAPHRLRHQKKLEALLDGMNLDSSGPSGI